MDPTTVRRDACLLPEESAKPNGTFEGTTIISRIAITAGRGFA